VRETWVANWHLNTLIRGYMCSSKPWCSVVERVRFCSWLNQAFHDGTVDSQHRVPQQIDRRRNAQGTNAPKSNTVRSKVTVKSASG